jgi:hypothetical protein
MEEDIAKKQEEERKKFFKNNMEYFYYIVPLFEELLNQNFQNDLQTFVEKNEDQTDFGTLVRNFVENNLILKLKNGENEKLKLLKNTFSYNFFTTIIKNPENQEFIHHSSPSLYGNNQTDGIFNKEFFFKTTKNNEIYIVITIFAFNNHF